MAKSKYDRELMKAFGILVSERVIKWKEASDILFEMTNERCSDRALERRNRTASEEELDYEKVDKYKAEIMSGLKQGLSDERLITSEVDYQKNQIKEERVMPITDEQKTNARIFLRSVGYDPDFWELVNIKVSEWDQHSVLKGNRILRNVKYVVKPLVEPHLSPESLDDFVKELKITSDVEFVEDEIDLKTSNKKLIECPAIELHLGKLANRLEVGENYDSKIAVKRFRKITEEIISAKKVCDYLGYETSYIEGIGNDFFNSDTVDNTTTAGTPQHNDSRWKKMFETGFNLYVEKIDTLLEHFDELHFKWSNGNHDLMSSFYLTFALASHYNNNPRVTFDIGHMERKAIKFGKNLIIWLHGNTNIKRMIENIPNEYREYWSEIIYCEVHSGHVHHKTKKEQISSMFEIGGIVHRTISSPSGTDYWHHHNFYTGAKKAHQIFVWDHDCGLEYEKNIYF